MISTAMKKTELQRHEFSFRPDTIYFLFAQSALASEKKDPTCSGNPVFDFVNRSIKAFDKYEQSGPITYDETSQEFMLEPTETTSKLDISALKAPVFTKLKDFTKIAAETTTVAAVLNTPISSSLAAPLVKSQNYGTMIAPSGIFTTKGWSAGMSRTGVKYGFGDLSRAYADQLIRKAIADGDIPELSENEIGQMARTASAVSMVFVTQPLMTLQMARQTGQTHLQAFNHLLPDLVAAKKAIEKKEGLRKVLDLASPHPFRGALPNLMSARVILELDQFNKHTNQMVEQGKLDPDVGSARKVMLGGAVGLSNNVLKTYAVQRSQGILAENILHSLQETLRKNPRVFIAQMAYSSVLGAISNSIWDGSIQGLKKIHEALEQAETNH